MDTAHIRDALRRRYAAVARQPAGQFTYPVGRASAAHLDYPADFIDRIPADVTDHFVGVGNPFSLGASHAGWRIVDVGSGAGFDSHVAAQYVGPTGWVIGVEMSPEMLQVAQTGVARSRAPHIAFVTGRAEALPVRSEWANLVISNGVLNLATCKASAFAEIARVLRPGGRFQAVDLILVKNLPHDLRDDQFAWSN